MKAIKLSRTFPGLGILLALITVMTGCTTPYGSMGWKGGYEDLQLNDNTYRVSFQGNGVTPRETVEIYALYRCAELTVEKGYDHFIVVDKGDGSQFSAAGSYASTTFAVSRTIKLYRGKTPADDDEAFDAHRLMKNLAGKVSR